MTIAELTSPGGEPLTLARVTAHLRLSDPAEDALLDDLIRVARQHLEAETGLALIDRTFRLYLDDWTASGVIPIGRGPVQSIDAITVYDEAGLPVSLSGAGFVLDGKAHPARLLVPSQPEPGRALNGIEIDFTAGFGLTGESVPEPLLQAMLMHVALMFEVRGAMSLADQPAAVPAGYERLIAPYRARRL